ncbi:unnamed protein product [Gordionus sp. m RMFG-2023]
MSKINGRSCISDICNIYIDRINRYLSKNKITDKAYILTQNLPEDIYIKLQALSSDAEFNNYDSIIKKLKILYPQKNVNNKILEFYNTSQSKDEKFIEWATKICQLGKQCNFPEDRAIEKIKIFTLSKDIKLKIKDLNNIEEIIKTGSEVEDIDTDIIFHKAITKLDTLGLDDKPKAELEIKRIIETKKTSDAKQISKYDNKQLAHYDNNYVQQWAPRPYFDSQRYYSQNNYYIPRHQN